MMATIEALSTELLDLVRQLPEFTTRGFSIYNLDDMETKFQLQGTLSAGVGYDGAQPVAGNAANGVGVTSSSAALVTMQFIVIIALQYGFAGQQDTKPLATDLLDRLRGLILGYKGVNTRPWLFAGERPESVAALDGVVFYSQVWHTTVPVVGNVNVN